jgi:Ras-related protein Rab-18
MSENENNTPTPLRGGKLNSSHEVILNQTIYQLKIILVGDTSVGKTSLVNRFMGYDFEENLKCTVNADFKIKSVSISSNIGAELTVWDTCGQERFRSMTRQYFKDAHGVVLVFDVGDLESYNNLSSWMKEIKTNSNRDPEIVLVANKIDREDRKVTKETGMKFAEKNGIMYTETSSKEGINIDTPFEKLAKSLVEKIQSNPNLNNNNDDDYIKNYGIKKELEKNREKDIKCC